MSRKAVGGCLAGAPTKSSPAGCSRPRSRRRTRNASPPRRPPGNASAPTPRRCSAPARSGWGMPDCGPRKSPHRPTCPDGWASLHRCAPPPSARSPRAWHVRVRSAPPGAGRANATPRADCRAPTSKPWARCALPAGRSKSQRIHVISFGTYPKSCGLPHQGSRYHAGRTERLQVCRDRLRDRNPCPRQRLFRWGGVRPGGRPHRPEAPFDPAAHPGIPIHAHPRPRLARRKERPDLRRRPEGSGPLVTNVRFLAAHNAPFDRGVLRACCGTYGLDRPDRPFVCTVGVARSVRNIRPTKLSNVCRELGMALRHHEAGSDALARARIILAAERHGWEPAWPPESIFLN